MNPIQLLRTIKWKTKSSIKRLAKGPIERWGRMKYPTIIPVLLEEVGVPPTLTATQEAFCLWNAERLGIQLAESRRRFNKSWSMLPNGLVGQEYRTFCLLSYGLYQVFYDDSEREVYEAYEMNSPMHFLRLLSYQETVWAATHPIVEALSGKRDVTIVDYGCGIAQHSRALAETLRKHGTNVSLILADIPTLRKSFLLWLGSRTGIRTEFLDCTRIRPIPDLPNSDIVVATEVFEHLHDPMPVFEEIHRTLNPSGFLVTNIADHEREFMHVSPNLSALRDRTRELKYRELENLSLFQKP